MENKTNFWTLSQAERIKEAKNNLEAFSDEEVLEKFKKTYNIQRVDVIM